MRLEIVSMGKKIQVNGKTFDFSDGILIIEDLVLEIPKIQGIVEFNRLLDGSISEGERVIFLKYLFDNSQAGIKELKENTGLSDYTISELIKVGYSTGLIIKKGQWKLVPEKRDAIGKYVSDVLPKDETQNESVEMEDFREETPQVKNKWRK
jgi:hypothetical protein